MPNYKAMYKHLFQTVTLCIELLQKVQQETEELYITEEKPILHLIEGIGEQSDDDTALQ